MIFYKNRMQVELVRKSAQLVSRTLGMLAPLIVPGATTKKLDMLAEEFIRDHGGLPAFKGMYGFPDTLCMSRNEQVVHGVPDEVPLQEGDIISVDCGVLLNGYYGDHAYTFPVGRISEEAARLLRITEEALYLGIEQAQPGKRIGDISHAIQNHTEGAGFGVVRDLVGHGLGKKLHEDPQVPNFGAPGTGSVIKNGLVIAIEPMINMGVKEVLEAEDGFTIVTKDGKPSAHFEHNIAVIDGKAELLSTFDYIYEALGIEGPEIYKRLFPAVQASSSSE